MVRLVVSLVALLTAVFPAMAGDRAVLDVIGYSQDARYFSFEEYGIQDGSGFPYSSIYIVDLNNDSWVVGMPISQVAEDDTQTIQQIRAAVRQEASDAIAEFGVDVPAEMIAMLGDGVPENTGQVLRFGVPGYAAGKIADDTEILLSSFPTPAIAPCAEWFSIEPLGYGLSLSDGDGERLIHRDTTLPRSRGCPTAYRIYGVVLPFMAQSLDAAVAMISVYPGGFEGPDRRFIAVPLGQ